MNNNKFLNPNDIKEEQFKPSAVQLRPQIRVNPPHQQSDIFSNSSQCMPPPMAKNQSGYAMNQMMDPNRQTLQIEKQPSNNLVFQSTISPKSHLEGYENYAQKIRSHASNNLCRDSSAASRISGHQFSLGKKILTSGSGVTSGHHSLHNKTNPSG